MDNNNKTSNNFFSGFLIGALVGAAVVFFLGTKKGKELLKMISEKGLDNVSHLLEEAGQTTDLGEVCSEEPSFAKATEGQEKELSHKEKFIIEDKPKAKRFFRGISRHLN